MSSRDRHDIEVVRDYISFYENMFMKLLWSWPSLNLQCKLQQNYVREQEWNNICLGEGWITVLGTTDVTTKGSILFILENIFGCKIKHNFVLEHSCVLNVLYSAQSFLSKHCWITSVSRAVLTHGCILVPSLPPVLQFNSINLYC